MRISTSNAFFYIPMLIFGFCMIAFALADQFGFLAEKRRLRCPPSAYLLIGIGVSLAALARLVDQAYPFQGDGFAIALGMVFIAWGAVIQRRERIN